MNYQTNDTKSAIGGADATTIEAGADGLVPRPDGYHLQEDPNESELSQEQKAYSQLSDEDVAQKSKRAEGSIIYDLRHQPPSRLNEAAASDTSKPPSVGSHDFHPSHLASSSHQFQTPRGAESIRNEGKSSSTFENSDQYSSARGNQGKPLTVKRLSKEQEQSLSVIMREPSDHSHEEMKDCTRSRELSGDNNYHLLDLNSSTQKESRIQQERVRRSCRDKTTKYSLTLKGMQANIQTSDENSTGQHVPGQPSNQGQSLNGLSNRQLSFRRASQFQHSDNPIDHQRLDGGEDLQNRERQALGGGSAQRKGSKPSYEQCVSAFQDLLAFDWSLKDINNLRHSPQQEMTPSIFWFYVSCLYFPARALQCSQMEYSEFIEPLLKCLDPNFIIHSQKQLRNPQLPLDQQHLTSQIQDQNHLSKGSVDDDVKGINLSMLEEQKTRGFNQPEGGYRQPNEDRIRDFVIPTMKMQIDEQSGILDTKNGQSALGESELYNEDRAIPNCVQILFKDRRFRKFKKIFKSLEERTFVSPLTSPKKDIVEEPQRMYPKLPADQLHLYESIVPENANEIEMKKQSLEERKLQVMIDLLLADLKQQEVSNRESLVFQFNQMKENFNKALMADSILDPQVYTYQDMEKYGLEFLQRIEPLIAQDLFNHQDWYLENCNEILLNVGLPTKLEKDFFRHIEQVQQKKSDLNYRKILKNLQLKRENAGLKKEKSATDHQSKGKRHKANQEDAQCAICNNGDYEDEDMIVFCSFCSVPVHQACYGIEKVPEGDWICYNCEIYGLKVGLLVECMLCPKRGGAMKPTNIFTKQEYWKNYNSNSHASSKKSKKHSMSKSHTQTSLEMGKALVLGENEDKNLSLNVIIQREYDFQLTLRNDQKRKIEYEFIYDGEDQTINDYCFFLHSNEVKMHSYPPAQTLYKWVHLSCASWLPGTQVTPKTPVRLNKFEEKRFALQCIICLKNEGIGACLQCQFTRCNISFHVECARRASYFMEIEKKEGSRDKNYKIFCEKHRPLKIVKEIAERDRQTIEEIHKYSKIIEKCKEIDARYQSKPKKLRGDDSDDYDDPKQQNVSSKKQSMSRKGASDRKRDQVSRAHDKAKKWREKDKKTLFEKIKEKYLLFRKMRITVIRVDPGKKQKKTSSRKRSQKRNLKKPVPPQHRGGCRAGLRSTHTNNGLASSIADFEVDEEQKVDGSLSHDNHHSANIYHHQSLDIEQNLIMAKSNLDGRQQNPDESESIMAQTEKAQEQTIDMGVQDESGAEEEAYFKLATPCNPAEMDWTITLSRNDFPWHEIKFSIFSAKDCYEKFTSVVRDPQTFLKKVLGNKEKYKKMMQNQLALGITVSASVGSGMAAQASGLSQQANDNNIYCVCKGAVASELFVKCDGDEECPNGGWVHPQCSRDLSEKSKHELDELEEYYCEDCRARIKKEELEEQEELMSDENDNQPLDDNADDEKSDIRENVMKQRSHERQEETSVHDELAMIDELGCEEQHLQRERSSSSRRSISSSSSSSSFDQ